MQCYSLPKKVKNGIYIIGLLCSQMIMQRYILGVLESTTMQKK